MGPGSCHAPAPHHRLGSVCKVVSIFLVITKTAEASQPQMSMARNGTESQPEERFSSAKKCSALNSNSAPVERHCGVFSVKKSASQKQSSSSKGTGMVTKGRQSQPGDSQAGLGLEPAMLKEREPVWRLCSLLAPRRISSVGHGESGRL